MALKARRTLIVIIKDMEMPKNTGIGVVQIDDPKSQMTPK
jgi:hypothetical protein